jgi:FtsK alpha domain
MVANNNSHLLPIQALMMGDRLTHRSYSIIFGIASVLLICTAPFIKPSWAKTLFSAVPATACLTIGLISCKRHHLADRVVSHSQNAAFGGFDQQLIKLFQPVDSRSHADPELEELAESPALDPWEEKIINIADPKARQLILALANFNLDADLIGVKEGLAFTRYLLSPGASVTVASIEKLGKDLMVSLGAAQMPIIQAVQGAIAVDVPNPQRQFANYDDHIRNAPDSESWMPIGVDQLSGELLGIDFADSNCPHALIGGVTGGGKSELLRAAVRHLSDKDGIKLGLIDVKMSTWEDTDHQVVHNPVEAVGKLFKLVQHMESRRKVRAAVISPLTTPKRNRHYHESSTLSKNSKT